MEYDIVTTLHLQFVILKEANVNFLSYLDKPENLVIRDINYPHTFL